MKGSSHDLLRWQRLQAAFTSEASTCKMILLYSIWRWYSVVSSCKSETFWTLWSSWFFLFKVTVRCLGLGTRSDAPKALRVVRKHRRGERPSWDAMVTVPERFPERVIFLDVDGVPSSASQVAQVGLIWNHQSWDTLWKTYKKRAGTSP